MTSYEGSCHCGAIHFAFTGPTIDSGLRCTCSICRRKGILMSDFTISPEHIQIRAVDGALGTYAFGNNVARHHFCTRCGIAPFHQTMRTPGHYRVNLGCVDGIDIFSLPVSLFDGAAV